MARTTNAKTSPPATMPCPACGEVITSTPGSTKDHMTVPPITLEQAMRSHFEEAHRPTQPCHHRDSHPSGSSPTWMLSMDLVRHPRPDVSY